MPPVSTGPTPKLPDGTSGMQLNDGNASAPSFKQFPAASFYTTAITIPVTDLIPELVIYGGAGAANFTLPTAAAIDAAYPSIPVNGCLEFSVQTTNTGAVTIITNTGMTLVGTLATPANSATRFRLRKTAAGAYTVNQVG